MVIYQSETIYYKTEKEGEEKRERENEERESGRDTNEIEKERKGRQKERENGERPPWSFFGWGGIEVPRLLNPDSDVPGDVPIIRWHRSAVLYCSWSIHHSSTWPTP